MPPWSLSDLGWCPAGHGDELTCLVILAHSESHGSLGVLSCEHCLWVTKSAIKSFHFQKWKIRVIVNILVFFFFKLRGKEPQTFPKTCFLKGGFGEAMVVRGAVF